MSSVQPLREFISQRLAAAAGEIFTVLEQNLVEYREEVDGRRRQLDVCSRQTQGAAHPLLDVIKDEELCQQETKFSPDRVKEDPPQIKEEQEELCISQEEDKLTLKQEADTLMVTVVDEKDEFTEQHGSHNSVRQFIKERLTAAGEEIFTMFEQTIQEIDGQRTRLDIACKPRKALDDMRQSAVKHQLFHGDSTASVAAPPSSPSKTRVATPDGLASQSADSTLSSRSEAEDELDQDNVPGYGKVEALADFLFSLRDQTGPLTNQQAETLISLWSLLDQYDRSPTKFSPRHKTWKLQGRFKSSKSTVASGVECSKRGFVDENAGPAQQPDCNRYVECLISKLCEDFPSAVFKNKAAVQPWTLISRAYRNIREKVLSNARAMQGTTIQLVEINHTTLIQWHNKKAKRQERQILEKGMTLPPPAPCTSFPLPPPVQKLTAIPIPPQEHSFVFSLPTNTSGQATCRPRLPTLTFLIPSGQLAQPPPPLALLLPSGQLTQPSAQQTQPSVIPRSTKSYQKKKREREEAGQRFKKYTRTKETMSCRQCGKERTRETHKQYYGNWFCQESSNVSYGEWRNQFVDKKYGKKK